MAKAGTIQLTNQTSPDNADEFKCRLFWDDAAQKIKLITFDGTIKEFIPGPIFGPDAGDIPAIQGYKADGLHLEYAGDLNDIIVNSTFIIQGNNVTNEPPDFPETTDKAFLITNVNDNNTNNITQRIIGMQGTTINRQWMRSKITSVWQAWVLIIDPGMPYPSEMVSVTGSVDITQSDTRILFNTSESLIDESGTDYTVDPDAGTITLDKADGVKIYEISYVVNIDPIDNTGDQRTRVIVKPRLDGVSNNKARAACYLREAASDDETGTSIAGSGILRPTVGQVLDLVIKKNLTTTCRYENRVLTIKRIK